MAKDDIGGVWRTVGGRRIFIKDGEDLETAMKNSGKFKKEEIKNKDDDKKETNKNIIDKNTEEFSKKIMEQDKESAIVFDDNGKEIIFKDGEQHKVEFRGKELEQLKDMNFTHNHPTTSDYDSTFSKEDLMFAYDNDLKSMTTINQKGDIIKLERDKSIKYDDEHKPGFLAADYQRKKEEFAKGRSVGELDDAAKNIDNWLRENSEKYGYKYERKVKSENNKIEKSNNKTASKKSNYTNEELYNMSSRQLATLLVENQIERGIIKPESKEKQIQARLTGSLKMSKKSLYEYVKKYL